MNFRVLYIEDDPFNVEEVTTFFTEHAPEFELEIAKTAAEGLALLKARAYDLLLLDYKLPDRSGLDIVREVYSMGLILPIVVATSNDQEEVLASFLRAGANDYVLKKEDFVAVLPSIFRTLIAEYGLRKKVKQKFPAGKHQLLYADSNEQHTRDTAEYFHRNVPGMKVISVTTSTQLLKMLCGDPGISVVVTELRIPNMSALQMIRSCRHKGISVPFIILTSEGDESTAVAALKLGAYDYIVKRTNYLEELVNSVQNAIYRSELDALSRTLYSDIEQINSTLEAKVEERTRQLTEEINLRKDSEQKLREALKQKDLLLMEIHHRVKNNLQVVRSMINLQSRKTADPNVMNMLDTLSARIQAMALVHQNLYSSADLENIDFSRHLTQLIAALLESYGVDRKRIAVQEDLAPIEVDINRAIPLSLLASEIVSNAIKHAFPGERSGVIRVATRLEDKDKTFELIIEDDGVGLEKDNEASGLGLRLIQLLASQLEGDLLIHNKGGTKFIFRMQGAKAAQVSAT